MLVLGRFLFACFVRGISLRFYSFAFAVQGRQKKRATDFKQQESRLTQKSVFFLAHAGTVEALAVIKKVLPLISAQKSGLLVADCWSWPWRVSKMFTKRCSTPQRKRKM